jgi:thiamine biosynthesis lipoprotein
LNVTQSKHEQTRGLDFEAIGTQWLIRFYTTLTEGELKRIKTTIMDRIAVFDRTYSRFRADSLVTKMAQQAGTYKLPADAKPLLDMYYSLYKHTAGKVTPLIGQALVDAGYDANYSLQPKKIKPIPEWDEVISYTTSQITLARPALLDFGAAGKGYLVDIIVGLIKEQGIHEYCVNAGGDMYYALAKQPPAAVGLENPDHPEEVIGVAHIKNQSICGTAGNRRRWANFTHIINPETLRSPDNFKAIWVVADSTMLADALTTGLCFTSAAALSKQYNFDYALLHANGALSFSQDFPGQFFN